MMRLTFFVAQQSSVDCVVCLLSRKMMKVMLVDESSFSLLDAHAFIHHSNKFIVMETNFDGKEGLTSSNPNSSQWRLPTVFGWREERKGGIEKGDAKFSNDSTVGKL